MTLKYAIAKELRMGMSLSKKLWTENCRYYLRVPKKHIKKSIAREITASALYKISPWDDKGIRHSQLEYADVKPIIELKDSSRIKTTWEDISTFSPNTKRN